MFTMAESEDIDWTEGLFDNEILVGFPIFMKCPIWAKCVVLGKDGAWIALDRIPGPQDVESDGWVTECFRQYESIGLYKPIPEWKTVLIEDLRDGEDYQGLPCKLVLVNALVAIPSSCVAVTIDARGTIESWDVMPSREGIGWTAKEPHTRVLLGETTFGEPRLITRQVLENIDFFKHAESYTKM